MALKHIGCGLIILLFLWSVSSEAYVISNNAHVTLSEEYNDNLYLASENEVDDFITIISPGLRSEIRWQRTGLNAAYDLGYSMYDTYSENDSFRHHADLGWWWDMFQSTQLRLGDTFIKSEDLADLTLENNGQTNRNEFYSNSAHIDLDHRFGDRRNFSLGYSYNTLNNDSNLVEDNQSHHVTGSLSYFFTPWFGSETQFAYTKGLYDISQNFDEWNGTFRLIKVISRHVELNAAYSHTSMIWSGQGSESDYQVYHPSLGMSATFGDGGTLALNAGYFVQDVDSRENNIGFTLGGDLGKSWTFRRGLIQVSASSGYEESQLNTENLGFTVYYEGVTRFEYNFNREVSSSISATYRNNDYVNPAPGEPDRTDDTISGICRFNWRIKRWLGSSLEYRYRNRNSNVNADDFTENRIMVSLTVTSDTRGGSGAAPQ